MHLVNLINTCQNGKLDCTCMHVPFPKIEKKDKGDRNGPAKYPPMTKLVSHMNRVPTLLRSKISKCTSLDLIQTGPYIENLGAVIGLVTFPKFVEINESKHNFLNGYRSYNRWWN